MEQMFHQFDGIITLTDQNNKCVYTNDYTAKLFGYRDHESIININPYEMRCPAVESAEEFISQYNYVFKTEKSLSVFDVHTYADGMQHVYMTKKSPIKDPMTNQVTHVMTVCGEINSQFIGQIFAKLQKQNKIFEKSSANNVSYYVGQLPCSEDLTNRQLEILYYLVQGYSQKEIAHAMQLSPRTVESYLENIKIKLNIYNRSQLIQYAINIGMLHYVPQSVFRQELSLIITPED